MSNTTALLISLGVAFAGLIPLLIALYRHQRLKKLRQTGIETWGKVEEVFSRRGLKGGTYYYATISFPLQDRSIFRHNYYFAKSQLQTLAKGNTITVIYDPAKPKRFMIRELPATNRLLIVTSIIAAVYIVFGILLYDYIVNT